MLERPVPVFQTKRPSSAFSNSPPFPTDWVRVDFGAGPDNSRSMWQFAFTLWFSFAAFMGPSLCCCEVSQFLMSRVGNHSDSTPLKPHKCCCNTEPASCDERPATPHKESPNCPCKHLPPAMAQALSADVSTETGAQVFGWEFGLACWTSHSKSEAGSIAKAASDAPSVHRLSGRALLTTYSILLC